MKRLGQPFLDVPGRRRATSLVDLVQPRDPGIIGAVVAVVACVGVAACVVAAWRGRSINPASALRDE